jgi:hypothetical protein
VQGSSWLSHRGGGFLEKSFTQDSLVVWGSEGDSGAEGESVERRVKLSPAAEGVAVMSVSGVESGGVLSMLCLGSMVVFGAKKPLRDCCPLASEDAELEGPELDFAFFDALGTGAAEERRFSGECRGLGGFAEEALRLADVIAAGLDVVVGFWNMSLIVRRLSNSGRSLPDSGSMSFVGLKFLNLLPSSNMPTGFMISDMWTCFPRQSTSSFVEAYTGQ